jgi:ATP-dependent Clp protease, protease subunit
MRPCFKFTAAAAADRPAILAIDDEIGFWGTQAKDFRAGLDAVQSNDLVVEINSIGGEVMAGLGMYNMLRSWAKEGRTVTTRVTGLAASIASIVALAGDKRQMPKNSFAMIHAPSGAAWGTEEDLREAADVVAKIKGSLRGVYTDRMGITEAKADELMAKDSWLTAEEAKEIGFATEVTDAVEATARYDVSKLDLPTGASLFKAKADPAPAPKADPQPAPADEKPLVEQIQALAKTAGVEAHAADIALHCTSLADAQARVKAVKDITVLCAMSGMDKRAGAFIKANKSVDDVRAALIKARAEADPEIDGADPTLPKGKQSAVPTAHSPTNIWAKHRSQSTKQSSKGK